jgi:hypothetical protein
LALGFRLQASGFRLSGAPCRLLRGRVSTLRPSPQLLNLPHTLEPIFPPNALTGSSPAQAVGRGGRGGGKAKGSWHKNSQKVLSEVTSHVMLVNRDFCEMLLGVDVKKEKDRLGGLFGAESLGTVRCAGRGGGCWGDGGGGVCERFVGVWMEGKYAHKHTHTTIHTQTLSLSLFLSLSLSPPPLPPARAHTHTHPDWRWGL